MDADDEPGEYFTDVLGEAFLDTYGPAWADEYVEEIAREYHANGLHEDVLEAHARFYPLAQHELAMSRLALSDGAFDHTVFHAARSIEGYARGVFESSLTKRLLEPIREPLLVTSSRSCDERTAYMLLAISSGLASRQWHNRTKQRSYCEHYEI
jgi:hypothetical protein